MTRPALVVKVHHRRCGHTCAAYGVFPILVGKTHHQRVVRMYPAHGQERYGVSLQGLDGRNPEDDVACHASPHCV